jgi:hypothetical protein
MQFTYQHIKLNTLLGHEGPWYVPTCPRQECPDSILAKDSNKLSFCSEDYALRYTQI